MKTCNEPVSQIIVMYCTLRLPLPLHIPRTRTTSSCKPKRRRVEHLRCRCAQSEEGTDDKSVRVKGVVSIVVVERYGNGTSKRYLLDDDDDDDSPLQGFLEEREPKPDTKTVGSNPSETNTLWLPDVVKDFVFPTGFPGSVSDDYLDYMLWQFPTNVTGWMCNVLVTSSLLKAVGVGSFSGSSPAATAAASAAAIRWVSKDGIGALGRLLIGGRFGSLFDDDPKQWRMYADFIGSAGSFFDLATQLYPTQFLLLASTGNLAKAVARGLRDPSFRVIQNHFAISGNLGEVAAKEEVWEVAAQLIGLGLGILIIDTPGLVKSFPFVSLTWTSIRLVHLWLRYQSLAVLRFDTINLKRARILVQSHVVHSVVPGYVECNKRENILVWQRFMKPRIIFGVSLEEVSGLEKTVFKVKALLKIYTKEKYILTLNKLNKDTEFSVSFKVNATSRDVLRCLWQAYWLYENMEESLKNKDSVFHWLKQSLSEMENKFDDFLFKLDTAGWNLGESNLKIPNRILIDLESIPL
ncbi:protein root UVB sensitive 5 isoform X1 [Brassica napus]|uniref:protein root UVB sensitive 5 isoform X1 n=1 Tax=Brassica oleracea var. oleracea TaxID=109376 RepID=UPI0006A6CAA3|nr:PREDICTED: protein root UVB sensitive 5 isoform X1 [Brassica oleracea var. oleracea]XP_013630177.1 PREDICTED: protein root UVB sensitive 5 isoform X1 [Brassica oleracea var. oleracea]XP_013630178.1 PREDICTED: protein root UVB sensitive 5 isoform X1 [Brassica oleracea var. oleracea]XP_013630179.1 PREDICTED: protein root UVB sensitive 5 isoform X1 [Brassica oleracea var. oleracea]XP_013730119.1 protein root UVB sensitive 5 isoform X1 [Brassica napus]